MSDKDHTEEIITFGVYRLDRRARRMSRDGVPVVLGRRAFDLLVTLAVARGEVVGKNAIFDQVWPGKVVENSNIQVQISTLRRALGDGWIVTIPGRGYKLSASDAMERAGAKLPRR